MNSVNKLILGYISDWILRPDARPQNIEFSYSSLSFQIIRDSYENFLIIRCITGSAWYHWPRPSVCSTEIGTKTFKIKQSRLFQIQSFIFLHFLIHYLVLKRTFWWINPDIMFCLYFSSLFIITVSSFVLHKIATL